MLNDHVVTIQYRVTGAAVVLSEQVLGSTAVNGFGVLDLRSLKSITGSGSHSELSAMWNK